MRRSHFLAVVLLIVSILAVVNGQVQVSSPGSVNIAQIAGTAPTTAGMLDVKQSTAANLNATVVNGAGSAIMGKVGIDQTTPGATNAVEYIPSTDTAVAISQKTISANTAQLIKNSTGNVYGWSIYNANASVCYLQFYNSSSAPTCGTSVVWSFPLPASSTSTVVPPYALYNHSTGIGFCAGTTASGATACATAVSGTLLWK